MMPIGAKGSQNGPNGNEAGFNNTDTLGNPIAPITNVVGDFGWEYVWHCHILSHEEMDMMRPQVLHVARALPDAPVLSGTGTGPVNLSWTDGTPVNYANPATWPTALGTAEVGYRIERADVTGGVIGAYTQIGTALANQTTFTDSTAVVGPRTPTGSSPSMPPATDVERPLAGPFTLGGTVTAGGTASGRHRVRLRRAHLGRRQHHDGPAGLQPACRRHLQAVSCQHGGYPAGTRRSLAGPARRPRGATAGHRPRPVATRPARHRGGNQVARTSSALTHCLVARPRLHLGGT